MEISSAYAQLTVRAQPSQHGSQPRAVAAPPTRTDGPDQENDGDSDDRSVTATRGNNVNIIA